MKAIPEERGEEDQAAQGKAHAVEPERAHVLHAEALGHEGEAPDDGGEKQEAVRLQYPAIMSRLCHALFPRP